MPGRNSWNGRWSGEETLYAIVKPIRRTQKHRATCEAIALPGSYSHSFGDGWRASVAVEIVDDPQKIRRIKKASRGFCGYDWMVSNIISHGKCRDKTDEEKSQEMVEAFKPLSKLAIKSEEVLA